MLLTIIKARNQGHLPLDMTVYSFFTPSIFAIEVSRIQPCVTSRVYHLSLRVKLNGIPRIVMSLHNISDHMQLQSSLGKNTVTKRKQLENHMRNLLGARHRPVHVQQLLQFNVSLRKVRPSSHRLSVLVAIGITVASCFTVIGVCCRRSDSTTKCSEVTRSSFARKL